MSPIFELLGGRRFIMVMGGCIVFTLLLVFGYITESAYIALILPFTGGYLIANGAQKRDEAKASQVTE